MTTVYQMDNEGNITELASYLLPAKQAIKNAFHQFVQNTFNTWNYDKIEVNIHETKNGYSILYGDNSSLYVKKS